MPGDLRAKGRSIVTLTATGGALTTSSAGLGNQTADFDARTAGNFPDDLQAQFELVCQWATITTIVAGTIAAELYLVPLLDGTNLPDVDLTGGASRLPFASYAGVFECVKAPVAATNMRFIMPNISFNPMLMRPYILNRSGQTISANWSLKAVSVQGQYT